MRTGGYIILGHYTSGSSDAIYQVRRGGDGVLYCSCRGWVSNLNAQKRAGGREPAQCKHTKDYVARHPGTIYGPQWAPKAIAKAVTTTLPKATLAAKRRAPRARRGGRAGT